MNSTSDVFAAEKPLSFIVIPINVVQVAVDVVIMECKQKESENSDVIQHANVNLNFQLPLVIITHIEFAVVMKLIAGNLKQLVINLKKLRLTDGCEATTVTWYCIKRPLETDERAVSDRDSQQITVA